MDLCQNERISIKNLLFTKAIPNYKLPIPIDGREIFACDCGDKFLISSSYEYHIHRKSLKITYGCKYCHDEKVFFNRCNLLSHIRSHVFKTATINISDLKIELLPSSYFKNYENQSINEVQNAKEIEVPLICSINGFNTVVQTQDNETINIICFDCKSNICSTGVMYKDRAKHYTQYTNILYSCPICLLTLPTKCALKAHIRLHIREPPYYCPECGIHLTNKSSVYPFSHDCESFRMMRVTAKLKCMVKNCNKIFHPNETLTHIKNNHLKNVYKCLQCSLACFKIDNIHTHVNSHKRKAKILEFLQCEMCPDKLITPNQIDKHLKNHKISYAEDVYPCWTCGMKFKLATSLISHQIKKHQNAQLKELFGNNVQEPMQQNVTSVNLLLHKASERCHKCLSNFTYHSYNNSTSKIRLCKCIPTIICHLCEESVIQDWNIIKEHYNKFHKEHVCLDIKISIDKLNVKKRKIDAKEIQMNINLQKKISRKIKNTTLISNNNNAFTTDTFVCSKCAKVFISKQFLEKHMILHKDPYMAYQCMECGESFIAKPSFSTHLLLKHGITDVSNYINEKRCYNEDSLHAHLANSNNDNNEPLSENQCTICREQFSNSIDLEKHFRVHGMAFLKKNTNKLLS